MTIKLNMKSLNKKYKYKECQCGHIVKIDMKYGWTICGKCGLKIRIKK